MVLNVSLVVEHVTFKLVFRIINGLFLIQEFVGFLNLVELIASPMITMVLDPVTQADPTELVLARLAPHIVAATIFLDCLSALGTLLGVGKNPCSIL